MKNKNKQTFKDTVSDRKGAFEKKVTGDLYKGAKNKTAGDPSDMMSDKLINGFITFIDIVPARRLGQNIRKLLLFFLAHELEEGVDYDFRFAITDLGGFFEFLDTIDGECDQSGLMMDRD